MKVRDMKILLDLDGFAKMMDEKGYEGFFQTEGCYPGRLKDSINGFLKNCGNGGESPLMDNYLQLSTYLEWKGEDKPSTVCRIRVRYENGKFDLEQTEMSIVRKDRYGQPLKQSTLAGFTAGSVPTFMEAVARVSEKAIEEKVQNKRGLRM